MTDISIINIELLVLIRCLARLPVRNGYANEEEFYSTWRLRFMGYFLFDTAIVGICEGLLLTVSMATKMAVLFVLASFLAGKHPSSTS